MPFHWGLEHIGGDPNVADPAAYVREYSKWAIEHSREWFAVTPAPGRGRPPDRLDRGGGRGHVILVRTDEKTLRLEGLGERVGLWRSSGCAQAPAPLVAPCPPVRDREAHLHPG